jgi:genome maintenance exonuclease 1
MKHNDKFIYPASTRSSINGKRVYEISGSRLPSVTTILSATKPIEARQSLTRWRERVGETEAAKVFNTSSSRGTAMHKIIEMHIKGEGYQDLTDIGKQAHSMASTIIEKGLHNIEEYYGLEVTLHYPGLYAGATDLAGIHQGKEAIIDFKQSNKPKQRDWIEDYFLQMAAYAMAHDYVYGTNIDKGVIMMCTPDNYYQEFIIEGLELKLFKHKFLKRIDEYYEQTQLESK